MKLVSEIRKCLTASEGQSPPVRPLTPDHYMLVKTCSHARYLPLHLPFCSSAHLQHLTFAPLLFALPPLQRQFPTSVSSYYWPHTYPFIVQGRQHLPFLTKTSRATLSHVIVADFFPSSHVHVRIKARMHKHHRA